MLLHHFDLLGELEKGAENFPLNPLIPEVFDVTMHGGDDFRDFVGACSQILNCLDRCHEGQLLNKAAAWINNHVIAYQSLRARLKSEWGPAARDYGTGRGGETRASPQRALSGQSGGSPNCSSD
jgi:hypothetical protein